MYFKWFSLTAIGALCGYGFYISQQYSSLKQQTTQGVPKQKPSPIPDVTHFAMDEGSKESRYQLGPDSDKHFTELCRFQMVGFAKTPQAWIMRLLGGTKTFQADYLSKLEYVEGDVVNGFFKVKQRLPTSIEYSTSLDGVDGILAFKLEAEGDYSRLFSQTFQWGNKTLPLEIAVPRMMHEYANWNLLIKGAQFLEALQEQSRLASEASR